MSEKALTSILVSLRSCAGHYLDPRNNADATLVVPRNFIGCRSVSVQKIEQKVAVE